MTTLTTAVVFPGQGSQFVGMLSSYEQNETVRDIFHEASNVLGNDLWEIAQKNPDNLLNQTEITQPVLLAASVALWKVSQQKNHLNPVVLAGHSLGEYTALVCSEALSFKVGVGLVSKRGKYMQEAVPPGKGSMAAIVGLTQDAVDKICLEAAQNRILSSANINTPEQIVVAGEIDAVLTAMELAKQSGAKLVKKLEVSVPSHCLLMQSAAEKMKLLLDQCELSLPKIPVVQNADAQPFQEVSQIKEGLVRQLFSPVRWVETVQYIVQHYRPQQLIECGPGKILTGLNKRILSNQEAVSLAYEEMK
jgi:[acyl-carrier-protein] S-malonyltransferase